MLQKDKLQPTQPYMVMDTINYVEEVYLKNGISHFFQFDAPEDFELKIVPDGCIDIIFYYKNSGEVEAFVYGTTLEYTVIQMDGFGEYFGIRFMPGFQPIGLQVTQRDLVDSFMPLNQVYDNPDLLENLKREKNFKHRIATFLENYIQLNKVEKKTFGKKELVDSIKKMVYDTNGKIRISKMQETTGYTERYINKVFVEEMGISPKVFCKIIQFQRTLEYLSSQTPEKMTDVAVYLGYYDQSQFIRDFKRFGGVTPKKYIGMIKDKK